MVYTYFSTFFRTEHLGEYFFGFFGFITLSRVPVAAGGRNKSGSSKHGRHSGAEQKGDPRHKVVGKTITLNPDKKDFVFRHEF